MNGISDTQLMAERLESLKAAIIGGLSLGVACLLTNLCNSLVLVKYFDILTSLQFTVNLHWLVSWAIAGFSGLLFGVTYRYIIRQDTNPQLKAGGVLAFGLVRGLAQIDAGWSWSFVVLALESVLWFVVAAIVLDAAIRIGWVKAFPSA
ncbi:hypothetical protein H6G76_09050 [Nostoc sp. FACHB-152]|uniref:hypothetical protein n=1 Tax=unclassified Nostoc TaxID=2593658 RepID=UPI001682CBC0|nr:MULTISPECIES: hypothetical protein [unclassified Nostoc]MBD2447312.1 hypothetical protein [Nostoc sp. FACHB-152]MBD2468087.1 hypothetical protein [Nostoc sp. FACHB-145]